MNFILNIKYYYCSEDNCDYKAKNNSTLKKHKSNIHDIGKHQCEICIRNKNSSIEWKDKDKKLKICRECFHKITGKDSKKEIKMSDYLDKIKEIKPYLVGSDKSFKSMGGCSLKRPDKLYMSPDLVLWVECDENQHNGSNGGYLCDEKRISDSYDEFDGKKLIVIRWNPDNYKPCEGATKQNIESPPKEMIFIYYMFYNEDNELISKNIQNEIIH
jgi:hypothetical protein